jgi:hypothetical protein
VLVLFTGDWADQVVGSVIGDCSAVRWGSMEVQALRLAIRVAEKAAVSQGLRLWLG